MIGLLLLAGTQSVPMGLQLWPENDRAARLARDVAIVQAVDTDRLAGWHELVAAAPHPAGSEGDEAVIAAMASAFEELGLEVEIHRFRAYLSSPVDASLSLVSPRETELSLREGVLPGSPYSELEDADLRLGWNAYSGSGDVTAEVVYANYGRREDFETLAERGVDCSGKIVVARYGGNFRGYKAKYAEAAGAAGLVIYTDPADAGYGRGLETPEGGWANCDQIQRGSLKTLPWQGDPLTPGIEATADAERLDPDEIALPTIPVQPVGWQAAMQILAPMQGESVPQGWQGGLPFRYRIEGGPDVRVRLRVEQERRFVETANVLGTLPGTETPKGAPGIVLGAHHDAWVYGANDPTSGTICVMETARVLADLLAKNGERPRRSITFAGWGAEEHGIIGSTEWVEGRRAALIESADLYVNLDASAAGLDIGVSASPSLTTLFAGAAARVPHPRPVPSGSTALDAWRGERDGLPRVGFLGGGSDHVSFLALCAVPSVALGARGAPGSAYHSLYDDLAWYRRIVGNDYASAALVTRITAVAIDRAAHAPVLLYDLAEPARALGRTARGLGAEHEEVLDAKSVAVLVDAADTQAARAARIERTLGESVAELSDDERRRVRVAQRQLERAWLHEPGLPGRPWYRNLYTAPDETSGYAAWPLPGLQKAIHESDAKLGSRQLELLRQVLVARGAALDSIESALDRDGSTAPPR